MIDSVQRSWTKKRLATVMQSLNVSTTFTIFFHNKQNGFFSYVKD